MWWSELVLDVAEGREASPMYHVALLVGSPTPSEEAVPITDDFCVKVGRELWPIIGEPPNAKIATKKGGRKVDVLVKMVASKK